MSTSEPLAGKTALVTGAARRLGRAIALGLAASGTHIVAHYNTSASEAESLREEAHARGVNCWLVQGDLAQPGTGEEVVARACELAGSLEILVNSASVYFESTVNEATSEQFCQALRINAFAPLELARAFARQAERGSIVNVLDARIAAYDAKHVAYHLSKRALHALTRILAVELAPRVMVNAVAPWLVLPPEGASEEFVRRAREGTVLKRLPTAESVVRAIVFLLSSEHITGQVIYVDSGANLYSSMYGPV